MQTFVVELATEAEVDALIERLHKKHGITGEIHVKRHDDGSWKLTVYSEKTLRDSVIAKIKGVLVAADA